MRLAKCTAETFQTSSGTLMGFVRDGVIEITYALPHLVTSSAETTLGTSEKHSLDMTRTAAAANVDPQLVGCYRSLTSQNTGTQMMDAVQTAAKYQMTLPASCLLFVDRTSAALAHPTFRAVVLTSECLAAHDSATLGTVSHTDLFKELSVSITPNVAERVLTHLVMEAADMSMDPTLDVASRAGEMVGRRLARAAAETGQLLRDAQKHEWLATRPTKRGKEDMKAAEDVLTEYKVGQAVRDAVEWAAAV